MERSFSLSQIGMGITLLIIINIPSVKMFTGPTIFVNILGVLALTIIASYRYLNSNTGLSQYQAAAVLALSGMVALIVLPEYLSIRNGVMTSPRNIASFGVIIIVLLLTASTVTLRDLYVYLILQVVWGMFIAIARLLSLISTSSIPHAHYNTVSLPLVLALCICIAFIIHPRTSYTYLELTGITSAAAIILLELVSLRSRAPYIGIIGATTIGIALLIWNSSKEATQRIVTRVAVLVSVGIGSIAILAYSGILSDVIIDRFQRTLFNPEGDSRVAIYLRTLDHIAANPGGYGYGGFTELVGHEYPHNLILHATFSGGWIGGILLIIAIVLLSYEFIKVFARESNGAVLAIGMVGMYLLFTFSVSYSLTHTYPLFALMGSGTALMNHHHEPLDQQIQKPEVLKRS